MRRVDDLILAGADPEIRQQFLDGIDKPLSDQGGVSDSERQKELDQFRALQAMTAGA